MQNGTHTKKTARIVLATLVLLLIITGLAYWVQLKMAEDGIDTFEKCAERYGVMESYPEQCRTPDGRVFTNEVAIP